MAGELGQSERLKERIVALEHELAQSERLRGNAERRTEDFAAQADCWFWETNSDHIYNYVSDNLEAVSFGLERSDFIGKNRLNIVTASDSEQKATHIDALLYQKPFRNFRYTLKGTKGDIRHILSSGWPIRNKQGIFMGYRGTARDETSDVIEREAQQEKERGYLQAIEAQRREIEAVIDNLNQSVIWFDSQARLRHKNDRVAVIHQFSAEQAGSIKTLEDYTTLLAQRGDLGPGDPVALAQKHADFLRGELREKLNLRVHLQAQERHLRARYAGLPDGGFVITHVDISTEVKTEHALEQAVKQVEEANHVLEERVEERTRELRELQSKLIKEERDATMTKLIAKLSHELRNPLNALNTSLYVIRSKVGDDPKLNKAFDRSERTIKRCVRILSDLYDYTMSRELKLQTIDVGDWAEKQTSMLRVPEGVSLDYRNTAHGIACDIDDRTLTKAVWKILQNAIQAVTADAPDLEERKITFVIGPTKDRVEFVVVDNGSGMPADVVAKAREPLFSTRGFGVGLGISFAELSFRQHGGGLHLESAEGNGTKVTLWLPKSTGRIAGDEYDDASAA